MEASQPLATESFSYSWLSNTKVPLEEPLRESFYSSYGENSEEFDFNLIHSDIFLRDSENFNFDSSITKSPTILAHADELFSDGLIRPLFFDPSKGKCYNRIDSIHAMPSSSCSSRNAHPAAGIPCCLLARWRKSTQKTLRDLFGYLRQFKQKVKFSRKSTRVDDIDKREWEVKSWGNSPQDSPKSFSNRSTGDWCYYENSIYEAVQHCKKSIEK